MTATLGRKLSIFSVNTVFPAPEGPATPTNMMPSFFWESNWHARITAKKPFSNDNRSWIGTISYRTESLLLTNWTWSFKRPCLFWWNSIPLVSWPIMKQSQDLQKTHQKDKSSHLQLKHIRDPETIKQFHMNTNEQGKDHKTWNNKWDTRLAKKVWNFETPINQNRKLDADLLEFVTYNEESRVNRGSSLSQSSSELNRKKGWDFRRELLYRGERFLENLAKRSRRPTRLHWGNEWMREREREPI